MNTWKRIAVTCALVFSSASVAAAYSGPADDGDAGEGPPGCGTVGTLICHKVETRTCLSWMPISLGTSGITFICTEWHTTTDSWYYN